MRIRLLRYDLVLNYTPGKYLYIADVLSRFYDKSKFLPEIPDLDQVVHSINISDSKKALFKSETAKDKVLAKLL